MRMKYYFLVIFITFCFTYWDLSEKDLSVVTEYILKKPIQKDLSVVTEYILKKPIQKDIKSRQSKPKLILYWTKKNGNYDWGWDYGLGLRCNQTCRCTKNRKSLPQADAVMIVMIAPLLNLKDLPKRHSTDQIFVLVIYETPQNVGMKLSRKLLTDPMVQDYFNMTVCYKYNADVVLKYFDFVPSSNPMEKYTTEIHNKKKMAAWFVSHCHTHSKRETYVSRLKEFIDLDIYGKCGQNIERSCPMFVGPENCLQQIAKNYKFALTPENTLCEDYLSEKTAQFFSVDVVPVVLSYGNLSRLPSKSFINSLDFKSVAQLAQHLIYLNNSATDFLKHFEWKRNLKVEDHITTRPRVLCDVCRLLHNNYRKIYSRNEIADWYIHPKSCREEGVKGLFEDLINLPRKNPFKNE